jgi:hypothetical protein
MSCAQFIALAVFLLMLAPSISALSVPPISEQGFPSTTPVPASEGGTGATSLGAVPFVDVNLTGNVEINTAGKGIDIKEGSNARMGLATLSTGAVTVSTTAVTADSRIMVTPQNGTVNAGAVWVSGRTAGTSFDISSTNVLDSRDVAWIIYEPN